VGGLAGYPGGGGDCAANGVFPAVWALKNIHIFMLEQPHLNVKMSGLGKYLATARARGSDLGLAGCLIFFTVP
jgi:hypothetical protein